MILAGDVGGTKVRLALFEKKGGNRALHEQRFASQEFSNLSALLKVFLAKDLQSKVTSACFGVAGPVHEGVCRATNLPWEISSRVLEKDLNIPRVDLINDLEANAWGLRCLSPEEFLTINPGVQLQANQALISAGTGLGEAGLYWDGKSHRPFASEGGHCSFAPATELEDELLHYLRKQYGHVSYERILSGSGLHQLYRFLIDTNREEEDPSIAALMQQGDASRVITEKGSSGAYPACRRACQIFVGIYGSEAGNLALKLLAAGGVFVGGGIAPHLTGFFREGGFMKAFCDKGRFFTLLKDVPVKVVLNDRTALLGAARFAQERE